MRLRRRSTREVPAPAAPAGSATPGRFGHRHTVGQVVSWLVLTLGVGSAPLSWADAGPTQTADCRLLLSEHRSARPLLTLPLDPARPMAIVSFTHSVLGTPVSDHYLFKPAGDGWQAHLVEERFEGSGYGLPHAAGEGETLVRDGRGWRLQLDRVIEPLVILPLPAQLMRVRTPPGAREFQLGDLSTRSIQLRAQDCPPR